MQSLSRGLRAAPKHGIFSFYGLGNFIDYSRYLEERQRFQGTGPPPTFWLFMICLRTVLAPVSVSFSVLMCYNDCTMSLEV